jgi:hypothetical protein
MNARTGHCLCGAEPLATRVCWCRDCQHIASNGTVNMLVPAAALTVAGPLSQHTRKAASGNEVTRQFCSTCGTHLFAMSSGRPQFRVVRIGNLDDPSAVPPAANIWAASAPAWACLDAVLERVEQQPQAPQPEQR